MIRNFRHDGLRKFWNSGATRGIRPDLAKRISVRLSAMNAAKEVAQLDLAGWRLHELEGDRKGTWSLSINAQWRITFKFEDEDCLDVDLEQYH